jgi:GT2 family glycosyltransferase/tetratricopeptide (TPR) repeat protein/2-polyprenyl-3-methyl-5-hydroxy-6-metoxy-1,4-benzoquinol methylase
MEPETVLVVVAHYDARPMGPLVALLDAMNATPAGWPFRVRVVANQDSAKPLELPERHRAIDVCYRENTGFNLGAWDAGWRKDPPHSAYLFLQDECRVVRADWVPAFVRKAAEAGVGLVGECLSPLWDATWEELEQEFRGQQLPDHLVDGQPADRLSCYRDYFRRQGIPPGPRGDHLQSLILFARREVLQAIDGFPLGRNHGEAIAAEIGISKKVQALGLRICEVGAEPFAYIEHPQWLHRRAQRRQAPVAPPAQPTATPGSCVQGGRPVRRVALIFDSKARPETTGVYCRRALGRLVEVEHFLPTELGRIPRQGFDLYLNIDDGLHYQFPPDLRPCAWWAIDTHLDFAWCLEKARSFDFVFAAQRDGAEQLRQQGIAFAVWLPLACDPELHGKRDVAKQFDVCFVGNIFPGPRADLVDLLQRHFPNTFVGQRYFEEMAQTYAATRIVFNRSIRNDVNMRVFEALASGSLLLTNDLRENGQAELFHDGVHLATYTDAEDLLDKVRFYLHRETVRERIAAAGRQEVLGRHTYRQRMETLLAEVAKELEAPSGRLATSVRAATARERTDPARSLTVAARTEAGNGRDPGYFDFARPDVLALIPQSARRVLDVGCGAGRLGEALKRRQPAEVVGIEFVEEAAQASRERLDQVLLGDVEALEIHFASGSFDVVVCADVLEHLRDPGRFLRRAREWLTPDGRLIASIPNVRHHGVVRGLLEGNWTYEPAGLLDRDHLRFFTRREIEKLFFRAGFRIGELAMVAGPGYDEWEQRGKPGEVKVGRLHIGGMTPEEAQEFHVYQYLVNATRAPSADHGLTSIVIVTHNELAYTRQCVDSIRQYTDEPYELIFVDNASTDGTVEYLRSVPGAKIITNPENRGFPAAANQGIQAAAGKQIVLLNNDTLVTTGWLGRLLRALHSDTRIGLVGPCSNCVSGEQQVPVRYEEIAGLDGFAWDWGKAQDRTVVDTDRLVGFCLLIRRELIEQIGLLDERFGIGCFEDDDYCLRAVQAGFRVVIARDAFVHHFGGRTFAGSGVDFGGLMEMNRRLFQQKWQAAVAPSSNGVAQPASPAQPSAEMRPYAVRLDARGGLRLNRDQPQLSLCMIVRNNAGTIGPCLESIRRWVDEMIVVDTGSTDATPEIAAQLGARVFHFPWCDSFSAARNESLRHARGRWIFWMDSDDTIDAENGRKLRELAYRDADPSILGYVMQVHCPGPGPDGEVDVTVVDHVKLFRNRPELRFDGRIHEQVLPAIRAAGGEVAQTDVFVVHSGYDHSPEGQKHKLERDLHLLNLELAERPEHPFTLFNLGMTYADVRRYPEAVDFLKRSIQHSDPGASHLRKAYALLVHAYSELRQPESARQMCQEGLSRFPRDAELRFREGVLLHEAGRLREAVQVYLDILQGDEERHFSSVDRGIKGFKARHNLAIVYQDLGDLVRAEDQWRRVLDEMPRYRAGWHGLGDVLLRQGKQQEALTVAQGLVDQLGLRCEGLLLRSQAAVARGALDQAKADLKRAVEEFPNDPEAWEAWCRFLFDYGEPAEAEPALRELVRRDPANAAAYSNLGTLNLRLGRYAAAADCYRQSLRHRAGHAATIAQLGQALQQCGRLEAAVPA